MISDKIKQFLNESNGQCPYCGSMKYGKSVFANHETASKTMNKYKCGNCGKTFNRPKNTNNSTHP